MKTGAVALVKTEIPSLQMREEELVQVMQNSIYPGAKVESIKLVLGYCKATSLDPMQKPVHIVPMKVKVKNAEGKDEYVERDVIMPGIGLYRVQAARSGEYGGMSEPEFGPMLKMDFTEEVWEDRQKVKRPGSIEYPEFCKITVKRVVDGREVTFTAVEYWIENYATAGNWTTAPNAMWKKRPRGQLAKCTAAQALRMAFPELGAQPTADELEGKTTLEPGDEIAVTLPKPAVVMPQERKAEPGEAPIEGVVETAAEQKGQAAKGGSGKPAPASLLSMIHKKMEQAERTEAEVCAQFGIPFVDGGDSLAGITLEQGNAILAWLRNPAEAAK
jgi:phage recombination protein Bet